MRRLGLVPAEPPVQHLQYAASYLTADNHLIRRGRVVIDLLHGHLYFDERTVAKLSWCSVAIFVTLLRHADPVSQEALWLEARLGESDFQSLRVAVYRLRNELKPAHGLLTIKTRASTYRLLIAGERR